MIGRRLTNKRLYRSARENGWSFWEVVGRLTADSFKRGNKMLLERLMETKVIYAEPKGKKAEEGSEEEV